MIHFNIKIVGILIFILILTHCCSPNYEIKDIQTGIANFQISNESNQSQFSYTYFNQFNSIPQMSFGINNLQSKDLLKIDFHVICVNRSVSGADLVLNHNKGWSRITINFIISTRTDLNLHHFQIDTVPQASENIFVSIQTKNKLKQFNAKIFLNGIKTGVSQEQLVSRNSLDFQVKLISFSLQHLEISFFGESFSKIKTVWLSYAIFEIKSTTFIADQGSIFIENFSGFRNQDLQKLSIQSQYKLYGLNGINFSSRQINIISNIKSNLFSTFYSSTLIEKFNVDYIILVKNPKNICDCPKTSMKYFFKDSCVSQCPINSFSYEYSEGGYVCLLQNSYLFNFTINQQSTSKTMSDVPPIAQNPIQLSQINRISSNNFILNVSQQNLCQSKIENSYFDGTSCICLPGFKNVSNECRPVSTLSPQININSSVICYDPNEVYIYGICSCRSGYQRINSKCVLKINVICGPNSFRSGTQCVCIFGYVKISSSICRKIIQQPICLENQINNGLGVCICKQGYYNVSGKCEQQKPCPLNSIRTTQGICVCKNNYFNISGECSTCPQGQYWQPSISKCLVFCGENSIMNLTTGKCQCIPNFGITKQNKCQYCPPDKLILNNYCVSCLQNQYYNKTSGQCQCKEQFYMQKSGICIFKCPTNQQFDSIQKKCKCFFGLGRLKGQCQICPINHFINQMTQQSVTCEENSFYLDGRCICKDGFATNIYGKCVPCESLPNTFMTLGKCSICPGQQIYNGNSCVCPHGSQIHGMKCIKTCKDDQLMDDDGNCFKCPINQVILNNQCVCKKNYQRTNDSCQLACPLGSFIFKDRCSLCPNGKIFDPQINGCRCPDGFYLNVYDECQKLQIEKIQCALGQYLDPQKGCSNCIQQCKECQNSYSCNKCQFPYSLTNNKCSNVCGNGFVEKDEQCDDRNMKDGDGCTSTCKIERNFKCSGTPSYCFFMETQIKCGNGMIEVNQECDDNNIFNGDGCSATCKVERLFSCYGQPSICRYNVTYHICGNGFVQFSQQCDDWNLNNEDGCTTECFLEPGYVCVGQPSVCEKNSTNGLKLYNKIGYNLNNVYISLQTVQKYQFISEGEMENFMKVSTETISKPSSFCSQRQYPDLDVFDCLLLYSTGIPNKAFKVNFWYISPTNGEYVNLQVDVDPLEAQVDRSRGLRRA